MKKHFHFFLYLMILFICCDTKSNEPRQDKVKKYEEAQHGSITVKQQEMQGSLDLEDEIYLPLIGKFALNNMSIDSTNEYGAGDCFGQITILSKNDIVLGIDSMICDEYGYTFNHYLLDRDNIIQAVHSMNWESVSDTTMNSYIHILTEKVIDFTRDPVVILERSDTIPEHYVVTNIFPESISKDFIETKVDNSKQLYKDWESEFINSWEKQLEY